jgi:uncharacterized protein YbcC (UPF0753/DUF2309 family)
VFIHHNTLHAFEHLPFEQAVEQAAKVYGAEAYLPEQRYLEEHGQGRITERDLDAVLSEVFEDNQALPGFSLREVVKRFLVIAPPVEGFQEVKWLLRESANAVPSQGLSAEQLRAWLDSHHERINRRYPLHRVNFEAAEGLEGILASIPRGADIVDHERTILWAAALLSTSEVFTPADLSTGDEAGDRALDEMINPLVIRFCEEYLDLGFSNQLMPDRHEGMLACFLRMVDVAHFGIPGWLDPLRASISRYRGEVNNVGGLIDELLAELGVAQADRYACLLREALALKGWAGYISLVEHRPDMLHGQESEIRPRFEEYMAIRLILRLCAESSELYQSKLEELGDEQQELKRLDQLYCAAYHVLLFYTSLGCGAGLLDEPSRLYPTLRQLIELNSVKRRRLWHLAYESNLYSRALNLLAKGERDAARSELKGQFVFCIDDREESIRRHLEARDPGYQSFGTAGFFGVDANYTMMSGATAPYCPVIIQPTHAIREVPRQGYEERLAKYRKKQARWFRLSGYVNRGAGSVLDNIMLSLAGCVSLIPMVLGVVAPRSLRAMGSLFGSEPNIPPDLHELQVASEPDSDGSMPGYTLDEMATRVGSVLRGIGLTGSFAPLVFLIGHGSSSRNNPLRSAYDCGACGGRPGRINARAFCIMANNPRVRKLVSERFSIEIPSETHFLGAFHNTCSDQIEYFDLDLVPAALRGLLNLVRQDLLEATKNNAFERCRRFAQAGVVDPKQAAEEAVARSYMLAEARPEYGHATNALCIVGPRSYTKGLFFDRRSFLVSYDHTIDPEAAILLGILRAVVPVCGGINLEYLFSAMDNEVYGAGSKLPHNIVSLVGIMNGTSSDLRTGLPSQMVEIHEPVRQLLVVVATRQQLERVIESDPMIAKCFAGGWMRVVLSDGIGGDLWWREPNGEYKRFTPSEDAPLKIKDYSGWFLGRSGHLPFAQVAEER